MLKAIIQRKICDRQNDDDDVPDAEAIVEQNRMKNYYNNVFALLERQRQLAKNSNFIELRNHDLDIDGDIESACTGLLERKIVSKNLTEDRASCIRDGEFVSRSRSVSFENAIHAC